jgi:hypothetical protein
VRSSLVRPSPDRAPHPDQEGKIRYRKGDEQTEPGAAQCASPQQMKSRIVASIGSIRLGG